MKKPIQLIRKFIDKIFIKYKIKLDYIDEQIDVLIANQISPLPDMLVFGKNALQDFINDPDVRDWYEEEMNLLSKKNGWPYPPRIEKIVNIGQIKYLGFLKTPKHRRLYLFFSNTLSEKLPLFLHSETYSAMPHIYAEPPLF